MITTSFVDGLWKQLQDSFAPRAEKRLARFVQQRDVTKWVIATDFCIDEPSRPSNSFAYVIVPAGRRLEETQDFLASNSKRDLKDVKAVSPSMIRLFRKGKIFSICFVSDRMSRLFTDADTARRSIDETISMMKSWHNALECHEIIKHFEQVRNEASKKSVSLKLLMNIILTAAFAAFIAAILNKHARAELIGWSPDRDKITDAYEKIASTMFAVNVSAICQQMSIAEPKLSIFSQTNDDLWCDPFIRLSDYLAGAVAAAWGPPGTPVPPPKIVEFVQAAFPDNPYLFLFPITFGTVDGQFRCLVSRTEISKKPHRAKG